MDYTFRGGWPAIVEIPLEHANPWIFSAYQPPSSGTTLGPQTRADSPEIYCFDEDVFERDYTAKSPPEPTKRTGEDASDRGSIDTVPNHQLPNLAGDSEDIPKMAEGTRHCRYTISAVEVIVAHLSDSYEILPECLIEATPELAHPITAPAPHSERGELGAAAATLSEGEGRPPGKPECGDMLLRSCLGTPLDWEDDGPPLRRGRNRDKRVVASQPPQEAETPLLETVPLALLGTSRAPIIIDDDPPHFPGCRNLLTRPTRERVEQSPAMGGMSVQKRKLVRYGRERALGQTRVASEPRTKMNRSRLGMYAWGICKE